MGYRKRFQITPGAMHGNVSIDILKSPDSSAFAMFAQAFGASLPETAAEKTHVEVRSQDFLAQVLIGHRIFCQANNIKERFVSLDRVEYMQDAAAQEAWLRVRAYADDFTRLGYRLNDLSKNLGKAGTWRNVNCSKKSDDRRIIEAETITTTHYSHRPSEVLEQISNQARSQLWRSVTATRPTASTIFIFPRKPMF